MIKRELKINFKSFIIWLAILIGLFAIVFLLYPAIIQNDNFKRMDELMSIFPEEVLTAFNMDLSSLESVFGWLKSEGFVFILLITGCYSGMLGADILRKEESNRTIEYLTMVPMTRKQIVCKKALVGVFYVCLLVFGIGLFNYIGLSFSGSFDHKQYLLLSVTPLFPSLVIFFFCFFLSIVVPRTKKITGISLGIVILSYALQMFSSLSSTTEFLKYFSVFTLADTRNVIINSTWNLWMIVLTMLLSLIFFVLSLQCYRKKDFI